MASPRAGRILAERTAGSSWDMMVLMVLMGPMRHPHGSTFCQSLARGVASLSNEGGAPGPFGIGFGCGGQAKEGLELG